MEVADRESSDGYPYPEPERHDLPSQTEAPASPVGDPHQAPPAFDSPVESIPPKSVISGFWRRSGAFVADTFFLGLVGLLIGFVFFDMVANLGPWARLIGFTIALVYFGVGDSSLAGGGSIGKRLWGVRVVGRDGKTVSPLRTAARYTILAIPVFLNNLALPARIWMGPVGYLLTFLVFGLGIAYAYLYVFNRRTRQSVHDLAVGTFVVRDNSAGEVEGTIWRPHLFITGGLLLLVLVGVSVNASFFAPELVPEFYPTIDALQDSGDVHSIGIVYGRGPNDELGYVSVRAVMSRPMENEQAAAEKIARTVIREWPEAADVDIHVYMGRGFDLGIATGSTGWGTTFSPGELEPDGE